MPRPIDLSLRADLRDRLSRDRTAAQIATDLNLCQRTVERYRARYRDIRDEHPLADRYDHCGRAVSTAWWPVRLACAELRRLNSGWGAGRIRLELRSRFPDQQIPATRTLQSWLALDCQPVPTSAEPLSDYSRADEPHRVWQMDAVEHLKLLDGSEASWLRLTDECSGAILWTELFPPGALAERPRRRRASWPASGLHALGLSGCPARGQRNLPSGCSTRRPGRRCVVVRHRDSTRKRS